MFWCHKENDRFFVKTSLELGYNFAFLYSFSCFEI